MRLQFDHDGITPPLRRSTSALHLAMMIQQVAVASCSLALLFFCNVYVGVNVVACFSFSTCGCFADHFAESS